MLSLKVRILEKIYHPTNSPQMSTPHCKKREEYWIRLLNTATPYGCNDKIVSIGNLSSPGSNSVNVMRLFHLPLDLDVVMVIDIIHLLIYIIFW